MSNDPDRDLAEAARRGDRKALSVLYERHRAPLFGFLLRSAAERAGAEDLYQEVWVKVIRSISRFDPERGSFRSWLFRIAANAAVDEARSRGVRRGPSLDSPAGESGERAVDRIASPVPDPERAGVAAESGRRLRRALEGLPPLQRLAVLLRHQQGMTYPELSRTLSVPEGTAKSLVHRGIMSLRTARSEVGDD